MPQQTIGSRVPDLPGLSLGLTGQRNISPGDSMYISTSSQVILFICLCLNLLITRPGYGWASISLSRIWISYLRDQSTMCDPCRSFHTVGHSVLHWIWGSCRRKGWSSRIWAGWLKDFHSARKKHPCHVEISCSGGQISVFMAFRWLSVKSTTSHDERRPVNLNSGSWSPVESQVIKFRWWNSHLFCGGMPFFGASRGQSMVWHTLEARSMHSSRSQRSRVTLDDAERFLRATVDGDGGRLGWRLGVYHGFILAIDGSLASSNIK